MSRINPDILDLILSYHMPVCAQEFAGNPHYILYWCYDNCALKELLGMTKNQYRVVQSSVGKFMRRVPRTEKWLAKLKKTEVGGWALRERLCGDGGLQTPEPRSLGQAGGLSPGLAAARKRIARKSYVGPPPPRIKQFD